MSKARHKKGHGWAKRGNESRRRFTRPVEKKERQRGKLECEDADGYPCDHPMLGDECLNCGSRNQLQQKTKSG